jgi:hypothetical protein
MSGMARTDRTQLQKRLIGPAGEHYVLFRLLQQGILAALAPPGTARVDVLVLSTDERIIATLQVKTSTSGVNKGWRMSSKHETFEDDRAFYAFVDVAPAAPVTYIVPSRVVAHVIRESHQRWLASPGVKGQPHQDSDVRQFGPTYNPPVPGWGLAQLDQYRESWRLLRDAVP